MSYEDTWWASLYVSLLTAYALCGWVDLAPITSRGQEINGKDDEHCWGVQSHVRVSKPYNSGDPRAG